MRAYVDIRKGYIRGDVRLIITVTDPETGRVVNLPPQELDPAFDSLQVVLMDMVEQSNSSNMHPVVRENSEATTALIPKTHLNNEATRTDNRR